MGKSVEKLESKSAKNKSQTKKEKKAPLESGKKKEGRSEEGRNSGKSASAKNGTGKVSLLNRKGYFGPYGGRYSPEVLIPAIDELEKAYEKYKKDKGFVREFQDYQKQYIGRPSLLTYAPNLSNAWGAEIYLKREDLNHTGAHKINNAIGQALLARRMGKKRIIAETGAGQHGVATATAAARLGFECVVYMGAEDVRRQKLNCYRMELLGAKVIPVTSGNATLKDATNEAMRDWSRNALDTHYIIGSAIGPHPFPTIVRDFQSMIGEEARKQFKKATGDLPDAVLACVGGGSNAIGIFYGFLKDKKVRLIGTEAGGRGLKPGENSASISFGRPGYFHGTRSLYIQDNDGQIENVHSVSAGLDYPGVGPEHAYLAVSGRAEYRMVNDDSAVEAFKEVSRLEGILPALETSHTFAMAKELAAESQSSLNNNPGKESGSDKGKKSGKSRKKRQKLLICLSGRGDKDVAEIARLSGIEL